MEDRASSFGDESGYRDLAADIKALDRLLVSLGRAFPFFSHVAARLARSLDREASTAGVRFVSGRPVLSVNPAFLFGELHEDRIRVGVLLHEILHIVLGHPLIPDLAGIDAGTWGIAADLAVNRLIEDDRLPACALKLDRIHGLDLPENPSAASIYTELRKNARARREAARQGASEANSHGGWVRAADPRSRDASRTIAGILAEAWRKTPPAARLDLGPAITEAIEKAIARAGGHDWRSALRLFASRSLRANPVVSRTRCSRRYGFPPGVRRRRHCRLVVAVDTSGSMDAVDIAAFWSEIEAIRRAGARVTVLECDNMVRSAVEYRGTPPGFATGRGLTLFDPVMTWVNDFPGRIDGLVYFTDGMAAPAEIRPRCRLLWVLADGDGSIPPTPAFGPALRMAPRAGGRAR